MQANSAGARERQALAWLYSLADQERGVGWNPSASPAEQWKLGRTRALLDLAGAPDRRMTCVLVAGTKGKGSTASFLASILGAAGVRTGLYTKPHLQAYRERVRVDGEAISPEAFTRAVARVRSVVDELRGRFADAGEPTTFEVTTALALEHFADAGCEVAVVEVGLGGRLDATNAIDPELSIITSISHDHSTILGHTLQAIAREKAGILRTGRGALLAEQCPSAARALAQACRKIGATCEWVRPLASTDGAALVEWSGERSRQVRLPLAGIHQRQNAALAVAAARVLAQRWPTIDARAAAAGLERLRWPGRFEVVPGRPTCVLDGAHNDGSAAALAETLRGFAGSRPVHLVVGLNRDKDARAVLRPLLPLASGVWTCRAAGQARALSAVDLADLCKRVSRVPVTAVGEVAQAIDAARRAASEDAAVCVTGSLAVVGQARDALGLPVVERLWEADSVRQVDGHSREPTAGPL